jgi:hypothetical protein
VYEIEPISERSFKLKYEDSLGKDVSSVFVYGQVVSDFHTLKKDAIFTINVAATQELDRQLQAARIEIQLLKDTLSNVMSRVAVLEG